jgi:hypothetical protein
MKWTRLLLEVDTLTVVHCNHLNTVVQREQVSTLVTLDLVHLLDSMGELVQHEAQTPQPSAEVVAEVVVELDLEAMGELAELGELRRLLALRAMALRAAMQPLIRVLAEVAEVLVDAVVALRAMVLLVETVDAASSL